MIRPRKHLSGLSRDKYPWADRADSLRLELNELIPWIDESAFLKIMETVKPQVFSSYTHTEPAYEALVKYWGLTEDHFVLTNGIDGGIHQVLETFCEPGEELMVDHPTYDFYAIYSRILGLKCSAVPYSGAFGISADDFTKKLNPDTKVVAVANPNGVIGCVMDDKDVEKIIVCASKNGTAVLLDEAYAEFCGRTWVGRVGDFDNLIVARTLSKAGGIAGLRFGYLAMNPVIRRWIYQTRPNVEINSMAAVAGKYLLEHKEVMEDAVQRVLHGKAHLLEYLRTAGFETYAGEANFILVQFKERRKPILEAFSREKIRVRDFAGGGLLSAYTRITVGPKEQMESVISAVKRVLSAHPDPV
jgi:histidinol-phosphate aminotransferase